MTNLKRIQMRSLETIEIKRNGSNRMTNLKRLRMRAQRAIGGGSSEKAHKYTPYEEKMMVLPVRGESLNAFVTLADHISIREDDVQLRISLKPSVLGEIVGDLYS